MQAIRGKLVVLLALGVATAFSVWLSSRFDKDDDASIVPLADAPDYYLKDFTRTTRGVDGVVVSELRAESLQHYPDDDSSELVAPRMRFYNAAGEVWAVESERGWAAGDYAELVLYGEVFAWREDVNGARELEIETRDLRVLPPEQYAETDQPVAIWNATTRATGTGMRANLTDGRIELLSNVTTRFKQASDG